MVDPSKLLETETLPSGIGTLPEPYRSSDYYLFRQRFRSGGVAKQPGSESDPQGTGA